MQAKGAGVHLKRSIGYDPWIAPLTLAELTTEHMIGKIIAEVEVVEINAVEPAAGDPGYGEGIVFQLWVHRGFRLDILGDISSI